MAGFYRGAAAGDIRRMADRGPRIRVPPPAIYFAVFLVGLLPETILRLSLAHTETAARKHAVIGIAIVAAGVVLMLWGMLTFRHFRTSVLPFKPATALVRSGPYRFTRNPMYVGMTIAYVGAAIAMNVVWPLLFLPLAIYLIVRFVIRLEEAYLARVFPGEYADFRARVRRWL
jgi:protein-S-isoprenylcysteine O-methyltransferase Ste14